MRTRACLALLVSLLAACGSDGGGDGGGGGDGDGPASDAAPGDAGVDGARPAADAAIGPACGATTCGTGEVCCLGVSGPLCVATGQCPTQHFVCDGAEDCAGGRCCFGNGGQGGSTCEGASTSCQAEACHSDADCGGTTPRCCPRAFTPGYQECLASCS